MGACGSKSETAAPTPRDITVSQLESEASVLASQESGKSMKPVKSAKSSYSIKKTDTISTAQFILQNNSRVNEVYDMDEKKLGEGTYGCVVLGKHKATGVLRAIKKISKAQVKDLKGLRQEIAMMKMMDHPNIIRLFETFENRHFIFLVMELCEGGELFDHIEKAGTFNETQAASLIQGILRAIFYMHEQDIVHRDLKPENFLLQNKGAIEGNVLKLIDFGTAREATSRTVLKTKIGTPYYVAPQVVRGRYGRECDVWSAGVIMYVLLSGNLPFTGASDVEIMNNVRRGILSFKEAKWGSISGEAKTLVRQLMRMSATERYTAEHALSHEWIKKFAPKGPELSIQDGFFDRWQAYKGANRMKKAALHIIAGQLNDSETKTLRETFTAFDADGNGKLTRDELQQGLEQVGLARTDSQLNALVDAVDDDGSGVIDYTEFIAASINGSKAVNRDVCWTAFSLFDRDGDGEITLSEITQVLDQGRPRAKSEDLMRRLDSNKDGCIDFNEFLQMMNVPASVTEHVPVASARMGGA